MATKRTRSKSKVTTPIEERPEAKTASEELPFEELTWKGLPLFRCRECGADSFHREEMDRHIAAHAEARAPRVRRIATGLVNDKGQPLVRLEEDTDG